MISLSWNKITHIWIWYFCHITQIKSCNWSLGDIIFSLYLMFYWFYYLIAGPKPQVQRPQQSRDKCELHAQRQSPDFNGRQGHEHHAVASGGEDLILGAQRLQLGPGRFPAAQLHPSHPAVITQRSPHSYWALAGASLASPQHPTWHQHSPSHSPRTPAHGYS